MDESINPPLLDSDLDRDPIQQFDTWYTEAQATQGLRYPDAMCLSTIGINGYPEGRMVLLKGHDERGFVFYSNQTSVKGRSLAQTPRAALTFYWDPLGRQIRIQGDIADVSHEEADAYFASRPRGSQLGAWASLQSSPVDSRETLEQEVALIEKRFEGQEVERPPFWRGYRVVPVRMEFWQFGSFRLHDRFEYVRKNRAWVMQRLYP